MQLPKGGLFFIEPYSFLFFSFCHYPEAYAQWIGRGSRQVDLAETFSWNFSSSLGIQFNCSHSLNLGNGEHMIANHFSKQTVWNILLFKSLT